MSSPVSRAISGPTPCGSLLAAEAARFREQGYLNLGPVFTSAELEPIDRYLREHQDVAWVDKNDDPLREPHYTFRPLYDLCTDLRLVEPVASLLGPDVVLLYCHILSKPPGGLRVAWHQDGPYWHRLDPKIAVTAWVALDDATPENGCMRVIPGSHRGHRDLGQRLVDVPDLIQARPYELPPEQVRAELAVDLCMRRGEVSLHDSYLVHGSEPNRTDRRRAAITIRYVPASTCIRDQWDRRQFLVRGRAHDNGNVYHRFGHDPRRGPRPSPGVSSNDE